MSWGDIIDVRLGQSSFIFSVICCLLVCFGMICIFFILVINVFSATWLYVVSELFGVILLTSG